MTNDTQSQIDDINNMGGVKPHHRQLIAELLLRGESIDQAEFSRLTTLSGRLAPRICDLRKEGWEIDSEKIKLKDGTWVARYRINRQFWCLVQDIGLDRACDITLKAQSATHSITNKG